MRCLVLSPSSQFTVLSSKLQDSPDQVPDDPLLLLDQLRDLVASPFSELPDGASPLQFPIQVDDKPKVLERLAAAGVEGADMWPRAHPAVEASQSDQVRELRAKLVGLPVHHLLGKSELARIAAAARSAAY